MSGQASDLQAFGYPFRNAIDGDQEMETRGIAPGSSSLFGRPYRIVDYLLLAGLV